MSAPEKILLVDDEPQVLDAYSRALRKTFNVEVALSGREGLQVLSQKGPFAVVVSDMRMPEMDGATFLTEVKKQHPQAVRIMLTGNADQATAVSAINQGDVFRFLNKPCSNKEMSEAITAGIEQHHCETIEHRLLLDSTRQLDYLNQDHDDNPEVQALNALSNDIGKLSVLLAQSAGLEKEIADQCHLAGMLSCIGDLVVTTRFKSEAGNPATPSVDPCKLAAYILGTWGLPMAVVDAIQDHRTIIEQAKAPLSVTAILHAAWFLLQPEDEQLGLLKDMTKLDYLSQFAGEDLTKQWLFDHLHFTHGGKSNA